MLSEAETINVNNGATTKLDQQIISLLPQKQVEEEASKADTLVEPSNKQSSIFSLTLDEIQSKSGKAFGSMNMEEFIANIWSVEENVQFAVSTPNNDALDSENDNEKGSFSIPTPLCKKTVDQIWFELHKESAEQLDELEKARTTVHQRQQTLGEMTLEDFLVKAGVVKEITSCEAANNSSAFDACNNANFAAYQVYGQSNHCNEVAGYVNGERRNGNSMATSGGKSRRRIIDGPPEVVVERRQRRMIKNRESAARSRARKQAYTVELEVELNQLKAENEELKQVMAEAELKRKQEILKKRIQCSTKAQKLAKKLRTMRRATSLA